MCFKSNNDMSNKTSTICYDDEHDDDHNILKRLTIKLKLMFLSTFYTSQFLGRIGTAKAQSFSMPRLYIPP